MKHYDINTKTETDTDPRKRPDVKEIFRLVGRPFEIRIRSDGVIRYNDKDLSAFELLQLKNYLDNL